MKIQHLSLLVFSAASFCASCGCSNNNDNAFLNKINDALADVDVIAKSTCQGAIDAIVAKDATLDPNEHQLANKKACFAYDIDAKQFIIMEDDKILAAPKDYQMNYTLSVFKFVDIYSANTNYSQYLTPNYPGSDTLIIKTGVDTGNHTDVQKIYYENNGEPKRITIRTGCDYLNINAANDEISHFNLTNNIFVTAAHKYHEYGTSAYIKASYGDIYFEAGSSSDMFEVPLESDGDVITHKNKDAMVYATINSPYVPDATILPITLVNEPNDLLYGDGIFYRLNKNIAIPENTQWKPSESVCLDLNGKRISFTASSTGDEPDSPLYDSDMNVCIGLLVDATDASNDVNCYILDSQSQLFESSGIYTNDCSIVVRGSAEHQANLYMNGGKVTAIRDKFGDPALIAAGKIDEPDFDKGYHSKLVMYGGKVKIKRKTKDSHPNAGLKCLQPRGAGAEVEMIYGNLESDGFCISGMGQMNKEKGVGRYGGTKIKITGGVFKSGLGSDYDSGDETYPVLFFPQSGDVEIHGGAFYGSSCITVKSGHVTVDGGTYVASGEYPQEHGDDAGDSGFIAEGSVMCIDAVETNKDGLVYVGGAHIDVTGNVKMTSKNSYIAHIRQMPGYPPEKETGISIKGGTFTYHLDKTKTFDEVKHPITINGGTWTKA